jgi:integrase/recombinase XerD
MSKDKKPQCPFIQRFAEDLKLARKSERTVQSYCRALRKLSEYLGHDPNQASEDDVRKYLLFITEEKKWSSSTVNVALQALKLYYCVTCPRDWAILKLARVKVEQKLPVVISIGEVQTLLKLIEKRRCKMSSRLSWINSTGPSVVSPPTLYVIVTPRTCSKLASA